MIQQKKSHCQSNYWGLWQDMSIIDPTMTNPEDKSCTYHPPKAYLAEIGANSLENCQNVINLNIYVPMSG